MGGTVRSISSAASNLSRGNVSGAVGDTVRAGSGAAATEDIARSTGLGPQIDAMNGSDAPEAPGVDSNLQRLKEAQLQNAKNFRTNLPGMKSQMTQDLRQTSNAQLSNDLGTIQNNNSARGLLYGGVNQGQKAGQRANSQIKLASGIGAINSGLDNAANTLDAQAIETGVGIQQTQQAIQNQLYSQAMTQMNANNSMIGSAVGTGLLLAMI